MTDETTGGTSTPKRVLVIQAHADDTEFGSAGTIAKWIRDGAEVIYCTVTNGDKGSADPSISSADLIALREAEQRRAGEILGVKEMIFLGYSDATLVADLDLRRALTRVMRQVRPDAMMTFDPTTRFFGSGYINHPDHVATGEASIAAVFPSVRDRLTFPELLEEGLEPHKISQIYLWSGTPDTWIDVSDTLELHIEALKAHASQLNDWDPTDMVREWGERSAKEAEAAGKGIMTYAESYRYLKIDE